MRPYVGLNGKQDGGYNTMYYRFLNKSGWGLYKELACMHARILEMYSII